MVLPLVTCDTCCLKSALPSYPAWYIFSLPSNSSGPSNHSYCHFSPANMALPVVRTLRECADYFSTVAPYLDQLRAIPHVFFDSIANSAALKQLYLDTNPLLTSIAFALAISPIFLIVSEINRNYSQVDRLWSLLPTVWNAHYAVYGHLAGVDTTRVDAAAAITALWSVSLIAIQTPGHN